MRLYTRLLQIFRIILRWVKVRVTVRDNIVQSSICSMTADRGEILVGNAPAPLHDAKAAVQAGDYGRAVEVLEEFTRTEPEDFQAHAMLGVIYGQMKDFTSSVGAFERAVEINPNHVSTLRNLARVYERRGAIEQAQNVIDRALQLDPDDENSQRVHRRLHASQNESASPISAETAITRTEPPETENEIGTAGSSENGSSLRVTAVDGTRMSSVTGTLEISSEAFRFIPGHSFVKRTDRVIPLENVVSMRRRPAPFLSQMAIGGFFGGPKVQMVLRDTAGHFDNLVVRKADYERIVAWHASLNVAPFSLDDVTTSTSQIENSVNGGKCPTCGEPVIGTDLQCMSCGARLTPSTKGSAAAARRERRAEMAPYNKLGMITLLICSVLCVAGFSVWDSYKAAQLADEAIAAGDELVEDNLYDSAIEKYGEARELGDERAASRIEQAEQKKELSLRMTVEEAIYNLREAGLEYITYIFNNPLLEDPMVTIGVAESSDSGIDYYGRVKFWGGDVSGEFPYVHYYYVYCSHERGAPKYDWNLIDSFEEYPGLTEPTWVYHEFPHHKNYFWFRGSLHEDTPL